MKKFLGKIEDSTLSLGALFTLSLVGNALLLKELARQGFPSAVSLSVRGFASLILAFLYSRSVGESLKPKKPHFQIFRASLAALSLLAIIASYHYVHASTVTLLQRIDLLVLCLLGMHASQRRGSHFHVWAIVGAFLLFTYFLRDPTEKIEGYLLAALGSIGIAMGYIMMKKSHSSENLSITIAVPSLSSVILGIYLGGNVFITALASPLAFLALASGVCMFASYYLTLRLYQRMNMATAEFPTLFAATLVMPLESLFFARELHASIFLFDLAIVFWLSWLLGVPQHFIRQLEQPARALQGRSVQVIPIEEKLT